VSQKPSLTVALACACIRDGKDGDTTSDSIANRSLTFSLGIRQGSTMTYGNDFYTQDYSLFDRQSCFSFQSWIQVCYESFLVRGYAKKPFPPGSFGSRSTGSQRATRKLHGIMVLYQDNRNEAKVCFSEHVLKIQSMRRLKAKDSQFNRLRTMFNCTRRMLPHKLSQGKIGWPCTAFQICSKTIVIRPESLDGRNQMLQSRIMALGGFT